MTTSRQRLIQVHIPDNFDDTLNSSEVVNIESSESLEDVCHGVLSQIKRIIHGSDAGNWHDNPETIFSSSATLKNLLAIASSHFDPNSIVTNDNSDVVVSNGNVVTGE